MFNLINNRECIYVKIIIKTDNDCETCNTFLQVSMSDNNEDWSDFIQTKSEGKHGEREIQFTEGPSNSYRGFYCSPFKHTSL